MNFITKDFVYKYHEVETTEEVVCTTSVTPAKSCPPDSSNTESGTPPPFGTPSFPISTETDGAYSGYDAKQCRVVYTETGETEPSLNPGDYGDVAGTTPVMESKIVCDSADGTANPPKKICTPTPEKRTTSCRTITRVVKPAYYSLEPSNAWDAGADNFNTVIVDNNVFEVVMKNNVNGVVIGLNEENSYVTYQDFNYAIYFSDGKYSIMKKGVLVTNNKTYAQDTVFSIKKTRLKVIFLVNGVEDFVIREVTPSFLYADCSVYASGDTIYGANVYADVPPPIYAEVVLTGYTSPELSSDTSRLEEGDFDSYCLVNTDFFVTKDIVTQYYYTEMPNPTGYATIGGAQGSNADLPKLYVSAYNNLLTPQVIGSNGDIVGITLTASAKWYRRIEGAGTLPTIWGYSAKDHHYAVSADIPYLNVFANVIPKGYWDNWALIQTPSFALSIDATIASAGIIGGDFLTPKFEVVAQGGADYASINTPAVELIVSGTVDTLGISDINVPSVVLDMDLSIHTTGEAYINTPSFTAYGEDIGKNSAYLTVNDIFTVSAELLVGQRGEASIKAPPFTVISTATTWNYGTVDITAPDFISTWVYTDILVPPFILEASEVFTPGSVSKVIVMNINTADVTEYSSFDFDNVIEHNDMVYGVRSDGIYSLSGDLDIDQPIDARFTFSNVDYDSPKYKFKPYVYFGLRTGDKLTYQPIVDEVERLTFPIGIARNGGHRVQIAKGIKGRFWGAALENVNGSDFELQSIEENIIESDRRI